MLSPAPTAPAPAPDEPIEQVIGDVVAAAALALQVGIQEWIANGQRLGTPNIKARSRATGDLVAELWHLKQATAGEIANFEEVARVHGERALRRRCNGGGYPTKMGDILIDGVIEILNNVSATMAAMTASAQPN